MMDELTIALLTSEFGQVCSRYDFVQRVAQNRVRLWASCFTKSHTTLGNMLYKIAFDFGQRALQNSIRICKSWFTKSHMTLGNMLYKIAYEFVGPGLQNRIRLWARSHKILGRTGQDLV